MLIGPLRTALKLCLVFLPCLAMAAVPVIQSVTDSAGYGPRVAPGSLASVFGTGLASAADSASGFPLTTSLGGTSVSIGGTLAPLLYVSAGQINFQVPSGTASGAATMVVNGPGGASASFSFTVTAQAPIGLSIWNQSCRRAKCRFFRLTAVPRQLPRDPSLPCI